jgi:hypothetical protein
MNAVLGVNPVHTQNSVLDEIRLWKIEHMRRILVRKKKPGAVQQENEGMKAGDSKATTPITEGGSGT